MTARKPFLLRTDPEVLDALQRWASDELRSVNGQIDFILRRALQQAGRLPARARRRTAAQSPADKVGAEESPAARERSEPSDS